MFPIIISIILIIGLFLIKKINKLTKFRYGLISIVFISLICELTIFNINSYRLRFSEYEEKDIFLNDCELENISYDKENDVYKMTKDNSKIILNDLNIEIGTIYINGEILNTENDNSYNNEIEYNILYTDETSKNYRELNSKTFINSLENSKYTTCYLSGKSEKIAINFYKEDGCVFKINSISLNKEVPFCFNVSRIIILISFFTLIYSFSNTKFWNLKYSENSKKATDIYLFVILFFAFLILSLSQYTILNNPDVYCKDFTESIIKKQFHLEKQPSEELLKLENPYDRTVRSRDLGEWDTVLYNGKYYIYFGILPQLILFVPYMLMTKNFLPSGYAVVIFSLIAILFLGLLLFEILKKWFKDIPIKLWIFAEVILLSGSVIFNLIGRPAFYEVLPASGLCFSSMGLFFAFNFFIIDSKKYLKLFLACLCLALSVACRPTMLMVSLIILYPILKLFIKNIKQKNNILKIILAVSPYCIIGILLMIYNYTRFNNPFEFGAIYQLTVNDMGRLKNRLSTILPGIIMALFKIPKFIPDFPFVEADGNSPSFFGYFYTEDNIGGLFILVPICFSIFLLPKLFGKYKDKKLEYIVHLFTIVGLLICFISIYNAGVLQRYLADYAWLLIISSLIIILAFYQNFKSEETKKIFIKMIGYITIFIFFINLMSGAIVGEKDYMKVFFPETFYKIRYSICFWE